MKRAIIVSFVVVAVAAGAYWKVGAAKGKDGRGGQGRADAAELGSIEQSIDATGSVAPQNRVEIKPPVGGRIEKLLVDEGD